ncbi:MAG TPA: PKD domain-containing protein [Solirubrobacteraceae bacterium]|nr:PKD domain-containing protein [Solirubrobacteraceae bacterium]
MSGARTALAALALTLGLAAPISAAGAQPSIAPFAQARALQPGYPHIRGLIAVQDGSSASLARDRAIAGAEAALASAPGTPAASAPLGGSSLTPDCASGENPGVNLCWWGGPVVRGAIVHLIFWQGPGSAHEFTKTYIEAVERFFERVAAASGQETNVFAVDAQYGGSDGPGEYRIAFDPAEDVYIDSENALPASGSEPHQCTDAASKEIAAGPCVTEVDLRREVEAARTAMSAQHPASWGLALEDVYLVLTPPDVGGCIYGAGEGAGAENACAFAPGGYCAYHASFGSEKAPVPPELASLPDDVGVEGCETYENPPGAERAAATLDSASHELSEIITDPLGSGWHDELGFEAGDKCVPPLAFEAVGAFIVGAYGGPLGGEPSHLGSGSEVISGTLYNQLIGGAGYWLQDEWSNSASAAGGSCVQRMIPVALTPPGGALAGVPATFSGSAGEPSDPADYWVWSFGDGAQVGSAQPSVAHTYATPGTYTVTLTEYDRYGNSNTTTAALAVGPAPPPATATRSASTTVTTITTTTTRRARRYSLAALVKELGMPAPGRRLAGAGAIALGHATCPPACSLTARIYAHVSRRRHGRRVRRAVLIGYLHVVVAAGRRRALALRLNGVGARMLSQLHSLPVEAALIVTDAEGGSFSIRRSYTLSAPPRRRARRARAAPQ